MVPVSTIFGALDASIARLAAAGGPLGWVVLAAAAAVVATAAVPAWRPAALRRSLAVLALVLAVGEGVLVWFHRSLWEIAVVTDPVSGSVTGHVAVPLWVESEKLYVWALILAVMALLARRHRDDIVTIVAPVVAVLAVGAVVWGRPFTDPLPQFLAQYRGYLAAVGSGNLAVASAAFQGMEGARRFYYGTWYMWVHPPLLFLSYGAFVMSFAATARMIAEKRSTYETTAYDWMKLGYLPLTAGMLLGFPWAVLAWPGESWWWSGKVNMSIMLWLLYTACLHARLYLRRRGMWRVVAALAVLSFVVLVLTYLTTYVVPGAHSIA